MNVTQTSLNSGIEEELYTVRPTAFVNGKYPRNFLKLKKSLDDLKQAGQEKNIMVEF